jgi:CheY-like chemotaxis protein
MRTYNIVIVENDEDEQFFMKEGFEAACMFRIAAMLKNGNELIEWLSQNGSHLPDLILSDLNMPGKNGYDIIDEIKGNEEYASIPVVITSTSSAPTTISKCMARGAADYLVKPETFIEYTPYAEKLYQRIEENQLVK